MFQAPVVVATKKNQLDPHTHFHYWTYGISNLPMLSKGLVVVGCQGTGVVGNTLIVDIASAAGAFHGVNTEAELFERLIDSTGSFSLQVFDTETKSLYFLNDPLGGSLLFEYSSVAFEAFAMDVENLKIVLNHLGIKMEKSLTYELSGLATLTNAHGSDSSYKDVKILPPGIGLKFLPDGGVERVDYGINKWLHGDRKASIYSELIKKGTSAIQNNVRVVAETNADYRTADITGGFDSRLVLAAIDSVDANDQFILTSVKGLSDWKYAEGLSKVAGMRLADHNYLPQGIHDVDSYYEQAMAPARVSGGMIPNAMAPATGLASLISLQGGYGEAYRTFYTFLPGDDQVSGKEFMSMMFRNYPLFKGERDGEFFFTESLRDLISSRLEEVIQRGLELNVPKDWLTNFIYLQGRNRYWIGQQSYWASRTHARHDPLYNRWSIRAALESNYYHRVHNVVGLDSMNFIDSKYLTYPFDKPSGYLDVFKRVRYRVSSQEFPESPQVDEFSIDHANRVSNNWQGVTDKISPKSMELAKHLGVRPLDAYGVQTWAPLACEVISGDLEFRQYINTDLVIKKILSYDKSQENFNFANSWIKALFRLERLVG